MQMQTFIVILLAHYVGDWIIQPVFQKYMGDKHKDWKHMLVHGYSYGAVLLVVMFLDPVLGFAWACINTGAHIIIDLTSSQLTHYFYNNEKFNWFWVTIGTDQTVHLITLILTASWLGLEAPV